MESSDIKSLWKIEKPLEKSQHLKGDLSVDVCVVGGGIAGFMCAYLISKSGQNVTLIEAEKAFSGVTINTTAHLNALQAKYKDISSNKKRRLYFKSQVEAIDEIEKIIDENNIDCDFKRLDSFVFGGENSKEALQKEFKVLKKINAPVEYLENQNTLFGTFNLIKLKDQAIFNPIKFLENLPKNFEIIENCRIKKISLCKKTLTTEHNKIKAKKIIIATNFPIVNIRGLYAFKMYKSISYAVNIKTDKKLNAIYNSIEDNGLTYRDSLEGIIVGGLDCRTGRIKTCDKFEQLKIRAKTFGGSITNRWAANDCMTFDKIPYAGKFKRLSKNIYLISGFGKWGMANSYACAKIIDDKINKRKNEFKKIYKPKRLLCIKYWHKFLFNALYNVFNISKSFLGIAFKSYKRLKSGEGGIVCYRFRKRAVYKDEKGGLHILSPRCPHMRCQLKFNPNTKTWDCPCHGSRLTVDGQIITAPTVSSNEVKL